MSGRGVAKVALVAAVLAALAWIVGFLTALEITPPAVPVPDAMERPAKFALFDEAWGFVRDEFYGEQPAPESVTAGAVEGLVDSLPDPYAQFWSAEDVNEATESAQPDMVAGLGAWVERAPEGARVLATVPDSPARRAGLETGQIILMIDDEALSGHTREEMLDLLAGEAGSSVQLRVFTPPEINDGSDGATPSAGETPDGATPSADETPAGASGASTGADADPIETIEVTRAEFPLPLVEVRELENGVSYLRISHFADEAVPELDAALADLAATGSRELVLDLRDNPGGDMQALRAIASRFVKGDLWIEKNRDGETTTTSEGGVDPASFDHIAVLVNGGSASAAEILAALLKESRGAVLVGSPTFGKSEIQGVSRLTDGSILRLTMGEWTTPGGISVADSPLTPDRVEASEESQLATAIEAAHQASAGG